MAVTSRKLNGKDIDALRHVNELFRDDGTRQHVLFETPVTTHDPRQPEVDKSGRGCTRGNEQRRLVAY